VRVPPFVRSGAAAMAVEAVAIHIASKRPWHADRNEVVGQLLSNTWDDFIISPN
jgi:hypothetical protein